MPGETEVWSTVLAFLARRSVRLGIGVGALAAVIGGSTVAYASAHKTITLSVDGKTRRVGVFAGTVHGLLADEHLSVGARDLVAPAPSAALHDGATVVVRYARPLTLSVDGRQHTYWTTELSVDQALTSLGMRMDGARLSASRSELIARSGLVMWMSTPKTITLIADGKTLPVLTSAPTVSQLLVDRGIAVHPTDRLSTLPSTPITEGLVIRLTRIVTQRVTVAEAVPYGVDRRASSALYQGSTKVVTVGRAGRRSAVYDLVLTDGKLTRKTLVSATSVTAPVTEVLDVGIKSKPVSSSSSHSSSGGHASGGSLNWAALAECESGGNPRAVNPAGYYGLYQFSLSTWRAQGGSGNPADASSSEQTDRAQILYGKTGSSSWPHCGPRLFS